MEPWEEIKEIKLKEIRAQMCLGWENNIDDLNLVEKTLGELMTNIFS